MGIKKLRKDREMRVQTDAGLNVRLFNESLEVELNRMPFGVSIELVNVGGVGGAIAPPGAYYIINFYKPDTTTGASGRINEVKSMMPGAVYLSREGVLVRGCVPNQPGTREAIIDYRDR